MVVYNSHRNSDDLTSLADKYKIWLSAGAEAETGISFPENRWHLSNKYLPTNRNMIKKVFSKSIS